MKWSDSVANVIREEKGMNNIVLIGMPGAGKSTVGVVLAKKLGYRFVDSDLVIQDRTGKVRAWSMVRKRWSI